MGVSYHPHSLSIIPSYVILHLAKHRLWRILATNRGNLANYTGLWSPIYQIGIIREWFITPTLTFAPRSLRHGDLE